MPYIKVYIHFVWATKNRFPFLDKPNIRRRVWYHIKENAEEKGIDLDHVNGYADHCHCLVCLKHNQTISQIAKMLKGESSHWINEQNLTFEKFEWQNEYFAVSVSEKLIKGARRYIQNQESHHAEKSWQQEYDLMIEKYGFQKMTDE